MSEAIIMKKLYMFSVILSIILSPLYSLSDENRPLDKTTPKFQSRITISGTVSTIIEQIVELIADIFQIMYKNTGFPVLILQ
jgi:type IV secretory pathway VirB10-like protein